MLAAAANRMEERSEGMGTTPPVAVAYGVPIDIHNGVHEGICADTHGAGGGDDTNDERELSLAVPIVVASVAPEAGLPSFSSPDSTCTPTNRSTPRRPPPSGIPALSNMIATVGRG